MRESSRKLASLCAEGIRRDLDTARLCTLPTGGSHLSSAVGTGTFFGELTFAKRKGVQYLWSDLQNHKSRAGLCVDL